MDFLCILPLSLGRPNITIAGKWPLNPIQSIIIYCVFAAGSSILCTSIFGLAGLFPSRYMQAAMTGQAMGGIFSAVANILTLYLGSHVVDSGLGFFLAATLVGVVTLLGFGCLYLLVSASTLCTVDWILFAMFYFCYY